MTSCRILIMAALLTLVAAGCGEEQTPETQTPGEETPATKTRGQQTPAEQTPVGQPLEDQDDSIGQTTFPTHPGALGTNLGLDYLAGELRLEDGCLKLYRLGWDDPDRTVDEQLRDIWLPVWPAGFTLSGVTVLDGGGEDVARAGYVVRLGGHGTGLGEDWQRQLEDEIPEACHGLYYPVGDEVSLVAPDEARVVPLSGSTLWFPRAITSPHPHAQLLSEPPDDTTLVLDGDCLRVGEGGPVVIWPAGFYPDWEDGHIVVRNGGGKVLAAVGREMNLDGGGYVTGNTGDCRGPLWVSTVFLGTLPESPAD